MPSSRSTVRVFVSSTFSALAEERNVLQAETFPRLERYCRERGANFQAIDLRWGVSGEALCRRIPCELAIPTEQHPPETCHIRPDYRTTLQVSLRWVPQGGALSRCGETG